MGIVAIALIGALGSAAAGAGDHGHALDAAAGKDPDRASDPSSPPAVAATPVHIAVVPPGPDATRHANPPDAIRSPAARPTERPARATRLGFVLELRSDFGFERLLEFEFTNDRQVVLDMNEGLGISAGVSFLPLAGGRFATRATAGIKAARLRADNGKALFTAFPLELMQVAYLGPLRLGAGAAVLLAPRVRGDGDLEDVRIAFDPAPGAVLDVEWIVSARTRTGIGVRGSWHRFASSGTVRGAPAVGLVIRADFDLLGR